MSLVQRVVVVGGGVIGTCIAWRAAVSGHRVTMVDPVPGRGASWVAGGMLAPVTEAWPGEEALLDLGATSLSRWPAFAEELVACGQRPGLRREGTVVGALDSADQTELDTLGKYLASIGREAISLTARELRRLEPSIGPSVRSGLLVSGDLAVDNRALLGALHAAAAGAGVRVVRESVREVASGLVVAESTMECDVVVIAAGAWSSGLHPLLRKLIRPVKGEIVRLRARAGSLPPPTRTVRGVVQGRPVYLVPRDGGGLVLGATQYEAGFDTEPMVAGVRDLLADAERLVPAIADYALVECTAGLRPGSADNLPVLGVLEPGVLAATGHGRNGILLAPLTADAVGALLDGHELPEFARAADVRRADDPGSGNR